MSETTTHDFSPQQAADFLGKSRPFVIALIEAGELAATDERSPGSDRPFYRITRAACVEWKRSRRVTPKGQAPPPPLPPGVVGTGLLARRREAKRLRREGAHARH